MHDAHLRDRLAILALLALVAGAGPARAASFAIVDSARGDAVGGGRHWVLASPDGAFVGDTFGLVADLAGGVHATGFSVQFTTADDHWTFSFAAAANVPGIAPGDYVVDPEQSGPPRLFVAHGAADCVTSHGRFSLRAVTLDRDGHLVSADVDFEQSCTDGGPGLRGVLRYNAGNVACASAPDGTPCDDENACTAGDACAGGACVRGAFLHCDDADPGTDDVCLIDAGCQHPTASSAWDVTGNLVVSASAGGRTIRQRSTVEGSLVLRADHGYEIASGTCDATGEELPSEIGRWRADRAGRLHLGHSNIRRVLRAVARCLHRPALRVTSYQHWVDVPTSGGTFCRWSPMPADGRHLCGYLRLRATAVASGVTIAEDEVLRYAAERIDGGSFIPATRAGGGPLAAALTLGAP